MIERRIIGPIAFAALLAAGGAAQAQDAATIALSVSNHAFSPAEPHAPANKPLTIVIKNLDKTPLEFESKTLRVEKIVAGGATASIRIRALAPGRYRFFDDYNENTTQGTLVVE